MLPFQPPARSPALAQDLRTRFESLETYFERYYAPYLFQYFTTATALDQIRCNSPVTGVQNSSNTTFISPAGRIRLAPDGTPQATLAVNGVARQYVTTAPAAGQWTLVIAANGSQSITLGTAPAPSDIVSFVFLVLA